MESLVDDKEFYRLYKVAISIADSLDLIPMLRKSLTAFNDNLGLSGSAVFFFKVDGDRGVFLEKVQSVPENIDDDSSFGEALRKAELICDSFNMKGIEGNLPLNERILNGDNLYVYSLPYTGVLILVKPGEALGSFIHAENRILSRKLSLACSACLQKSEMDMELSSTSLINRELADSEKQLVRTVREMRAVQEELNAGKNHLALILQSLGEGVIVTDGSGRVLLSNIRALEYLDVMPYDGSHIIMSDLLVNCSDEFCSKFKGGMERGGIEQIIEFEVYGKHVAQRYLRMIVNSLESVLSGSPETIYLIQDISREKEIDRIKNEFISNLSHELRTPMNAILGISRMLSDKNAENLYDRQKQGLSIINESGHRLLSLINDILDLSKIEAGKMEIVARRVKVRDIIDHITKITAPLVSPGVVFKSFISPEVPDDIVVDDLRVQQVILNLVGNSLKFTSDGSVELSVAMKDGMIVFSVADTGIGIAEKDLPFVFERFKQGDGSMARKYQGTGIGLSLSREIVSLMGGTISAESVYGQGTVMRFDVPMGLNTEEQNEILSSVMPDMTASNMETFFRSGLITLLVVEDEDAGRETLRFILADRFNLIFAENGKEAVKSFNENRIDLVLMDIMMPEMDGYHVYDAIRKTDYGKYVPIVAVTARAMMGDKDKIIAHGFDAYVSKPIDSELLIVTIMNLLKTRVEGGYYD